MTAHPPLWVLVVMSAVGPFALNAFAPSLPNLADAFDSDYGTAQLALTLYLFSVAGGQLIYGPLSDRFGRRPVLLWGLALGCAGSFLCLVAPTMTTLLVGRIAQGIGSCAGLVLSRAIVRDIYPRDASASILGYVTMGMVMMPMVAPGIGGLLDQNFGWRASFVAMLAFALFGLWASYRHSPETHHTRHARLDFVSVLRGSGALLRSRAFLGYTVSVSFNSIQFFGFLAAGPYLVVTVLGGSPAEYGLWFAFCAASYAVGNFSAGRWSKTLGLDRMARIGNTIGLFPGAMALYAAFFVDLQIAAFFVPFFLLGFTNGMVQPNLIAGAVSVNPALAGSASGLVGCIQTSAGAVSTLIMGHTQDGTMLPLALLFGVCGIGALCSHVMAVRALASPKDT
jgi:MFS transporter, DHA1 family, multidrug resistance protein